MMRLWEALELASSELKQVNKNTRINRAIKSRENSKLNYWVVLCILSATYIVKQIISPWPCPYLAAAIKIFSHQDIPLFETQKRQFKESIYQHEHSGKWHVNHGCSTGFNLVHINNCSSTGANLLPESLFSRRCVLLDLNLLRLSFRIPSTVSTVEIGQLGECDD